MTPAQSAGIENSTWMVAELVERCGEYKRLHGDIEVFDLNGHPKAECAYASGHLDGEKDERTRFNAVLEIPPVVSAETAVRVQIIKDVKELK
jgi:hypothetical protein